MWDLFLLLVPSADSSEMELYFDAASRVVDGQLPYRDFLWVYPPGMLLLFVIIRWFVVDIEGFRNLYFAMLVLSGVVMTYGLYWFASKRLSMKLPYLQLIAASLFLFLSVTANKTFINPELVANLFVLGALGLFARRHVNWAMFLLGCATAFRVYPLVLTPLFVRLPWRQKRNWLRYVSFIVPWSLSFLPYGLYRALGDFANQALFYHVERPVEIESYWASLMVWVSQYGVYPIRVVLNHTFNVIELEFIGEKPWWWFFTTIYLWAPLLMSLVAVFRFRQKSRRYTYWPVHLFRLSLLLILAVIIRSQVFSPQYLIWLWVPFFLWICEGYLRKVLSVKEIVGLVLLLVVIHAVTSMYLIYFLPEYVPYLYHLSMLPMVIIFTRNLLLLGLFALVWVRKTPH